MKKLNQNRSTLHFRQLLAFLLVFSLLHMNVPLSAAMPAKVPVSVANFPIRLNGVLLRDQKESYYPMLVYQGITYLPMTADYGRFLNLMAHWVEEKSMVTIYSWNISFSPLSYYDPSPTLPQGVTNQNLYAQPVWYPVSVNGEALDLNSQPYPILNFRNITYFPLTWHFAVDLFDLNYRFTATDGLEIKSSGYQPEAAPQDLPAPLNADPSILPLLKETQSLVLPKSAFADPIVYKNGLLFYFVNHGENSTSLDFWRRPLNGQAEKIGSAEIADGIKMPIGYHYPWLLSNNDLFFTSHFGGAIMGSEQQYFLPDSGQSRLISNQRLSWLIPWREQWIGSYFSVTGPLPGLFLMNQQGEVKDIDSSDQIFSVPDDSKYCVQGDLLFVSAKNQSGRQDLYQINLKTNEQKKLAFNINQYLADQNSIYYTANQTDSPLYRLNPATGQSETFISLPQKEYRSLSVYNGVAMLVQIQYPSSDLYRSHNGQWQRLVADIDYRCQRNAEHLVYRATHQGKHYIVVCASDGIAQAAFRSENQDVDFALNGNELIIWSWQDQTVRYFKL